MKKNTRSLLEELELISKTHDTRHIIESRAANIITSAIHLLEVIERNYSAEQASLLEKKLLVAIKSRDGGKFSRGLKRVETDDEK